MSWSKSKSPKQADEAAKPTQQVAEFDEWEGDARQEVPSKQVNTTLPCWLIDELDAEAARRSVSRKAVINSWLVDRADAEIDRRHQVAAG